MNRLWVLLLLVLLQLGVDAALISQFPPVGRDFIIQPTAGTISGLDGRREVDDYSSRKAQAAD